LIFKSDKKRSLKKAFSFFFFHTNINAAHL